MIRGAHTRVDHEQELKHAQFGVERPNISRTIQKCACCIEAEAERHRGRRFYIQGSM